MGWDSFQVAEETIVPLADLAFTGKKWQDIRTALNGAGKAGITAEWITLSRAPLVITDQIRAISEEWVADQGLPEMGFTLGGLDELADDRVRCLIAVDADRTVHGITSWLPVHEPATPAAIDDGPAAVVGWTLDFMRRRDTGDSATALPGRGGAARHRHRDRPRLHPGHRGRAVDATPTPDPPEMSRGRGIAVVRPSSSAPEVSHRPLTQPEAR